MPTAKLIAIARVTSQVSRSGYGLDADDLQQAANLAILLTEADGRHLSVAHSRRKAGWVALDSRRARMKEYKRHQPISAAGHCTVPSSEGQVLLSSLRALLAEVSRKLTPQENRVIRMVYEEGLTGRSIAEAIRLSERRVSTIRRNAEEKLRQGLLERSITSASDLL